MWPKIKVITIQTRWLLISLTLCKEKASPKSSSKEMTFIRVAIV
jgi:hypothetical protein